MQNKVKGRMDKYNAGERRDMERQMQRGRLYNPGIWNRRYSTPRTERKE